MSKLAALFIVFAFCAAQVQISARADNERDQKGTPPGLAKKGGLPPGQARKQQSQEDTQTAPANSQSSPTTAPSTSPSPAQPAGPNTPTPNSVPSVPAEQKETLESHVRLINDATRAPRVKAIAFQQIAKETGVRVVILEEQEKNHPGIGMSALLLANLISKQGNVKFRDVVDEREKGRPWAEIAAWHRVQVAPLLQKASDVASVVKAVQEANRR